MIHHYNYSTSLSQFLNYHQLDDPQLGEENDHPSSNTPCGEDFSTQDSQLNLRPSSINTKSSFTIAAILGLKNENHHHHNNNKNPNLRLNNEEEEDQDEDETDETAMNRFLDENHHFNRNFTNNNNNNSAVNLTTGGTSSAAAVAASAIININGGNRSGAYGVAAGLVSSTSSAAADCNISTRLQFPGGVNNPTSLSSALSVTASSGGQHYSLVDQHLHHHHHHHHNNNNNSVGGLISGVGCPVSSRQPQQQQQTVRGLKHSISSNVLQSKKASKSKRVRTIFTPEQLERLEAEFERQQYMVGPERLYLAHTLQLTEAQVKVWFQNRRIKWRKHHLELTHQRLAVLKQQQLLLESNGGGGIGDEASTSNTNPDLQDTNSSGTET